MKKINTLFEILTKPKLLRSLLSLKYNGYLQEMGWFNSAVTKQSIDKSGNPLPWYSYSFINFIETRLKKTFNVFEWGSGNSTIWFASRINHITAVENDNFWYNKLLKELPNNCSLNLKSDRKEYSRFILESSIEYEIIIIDGIERINCAKNSIKKIKEDGIIIFDNSERIEYKEAIDFLISRGFLKIDFFSIGPIVNRNTCTSVFYRRENCLKI